MKSGWGKPKIQSEYYKFAKHQKKEQDQIIRHQVDKIRTAIQ